MSDNSLCFCGEGSVPVTQPSPSFFLGKRMAARKALAKLISGKTADVKSAAAHGYIKQQTF